MGRVPNSTAGRKLYEKERGIVKVMNHSIQDEVITIFFGTKKKLFHKKMNSCIFSFNFLGTGHERDHDLSFSLLRIFDIDS